MPRKPKNDNPIALYDIYASFSNFPQSRQYQQELVSKIYDTVKAPGGSISVGEAIDGRIYHVAKRLYDKSHELYRNLSRTEQLVLDSLHRINQCSTADERESRFERLCMQIEDVDDSEISDRVNNAAKQVLGRGIRISENQGPVPYFRK